MKTSQAESDTIRAWAERVLADLPALFRRRKLAEVLSKSERTLLRDERRGLLQVMRSGPHGWPTISKQAAVDYLVRLHDAEARG